MTQAHQQLIEEEQYPAEQEWGRATSQGLCPGCDWSFIFPSQQSNPICPHCFQEGLRIENTPEEQANVNQSYIPELFIPYKITTNSITNQLEEFSRTIPFHSFDMETGPVRRLHQVYLPRWLVDADVKASWQADIGFDYQVLSHQERYSQSLGRWSTQEIKEQRIRWEKLLGTLDRHYDNIPAPAIEHEPLVRDLIRDFDPELAIPYTSLCIQDCLVRTPNRIPEDAWRDAKAKIQAIAADECRQATRGNHIRQFSWKASFMNPVWTLLLLPVYTTFYFDDQGKPVPLLINGTTGQIFGKRIASQKRAQRTALLLLITGILVFLLGLALAFASLLLAPLLIVGILGMSFALLIGLSAIYPIARVWWFNQHQK